MRKRRVGMGLGLVLFCTALLGCAEQASLFGPEASGHRSSYRVRMDTSAMMLFEGDTVVLPSVDLGGKDLLGVEALLFDSVGGVQWRSRRVSPVEGMVRIPVEGLSSAVPRSRELRLTVQSNFPGGVSLYPSSDSVGVKVLSAAVSRSVVVRPGRYVGGRFSPGATSGFLGVAGLGRVYWTDRERGAVGTYDLATSNGASWPAGAVPTGLAYGGGKLAVLTGSGSEVLELDARSGEERGRVLLPPLVLRVEVPTGEADSLGVRPTEVTRIPVRPYGTSIAMACPSVGCEEPVPFVASPAAGSAGTFGIGVLRRARAGVAFGLEPVLLPFRRVDLDTLAADFQVLSAAGSGADSVVLHVREVSRCLSYALGGGWVAASSVPGGAVYTAVDDAVSPCGEGTRLIRVDNAWGGSPRYSAFGERNLVGEDRIGAVRGLGVSEDGERLVVLGSDSVFVLDANQRVRGILRVPGARSVSWLQGGNAGLFAVATSSELWVCDAVRLTVLRRFSVGPTVAGQLVFLRVSESVLLVAPVEGRSGFVVLDVGKL